MGWRPDVGQAGWEQCSCLPEAIMDVHWRLLLQVTWPSAGHAVQPLSQAVHQAAAAEGGQACCQARIGSRVAGMLLLHIHLRAGRRESRGAGDYAHGHNRQQEAGLLGMDARAGRGCALQQPACAFRPCCLGMTSTHPCSAEAGAPAEAAADTRSSPGEVRSSWAAQGKRGEQQTVSGVVSNSCISHCFALQIDDAAQLSWRRCSCHAGCHPPAGRSRTAGRRTRPAGVHNSAHTVQRGGSRQRLCITGTLLHRVRPHPVPHPRARLAHLRAGVAGGRGRIAVSGAAVLGLCVVSCMSSKGGGRAQGSCGLSAAASPEQGLRTQVEDTRQAVRRRSREASAASPAQQQQQLLHPLAAVNHTDSHLQGTLHRVWKQR